MARHMADGEGEAPDSVRTGDEAERLDDLVVIGRVARAHGNRGQVIVNPETDFPGERFRVGESVRVGVEGRWRTIRAVRFHRGRPILALDGIETMNDAELLAGAELQAPAGAPGTLPAGTFYHYDLVGCEVLDAAGGHVGRVMNVEGAMEMSRLVVHPPGGGEVLIPLVDEFCVSIDVAARRIVVDLPAGLLELNEPRIRS